MLVLTVSKKGKEFVQLCDSDGKQICKVVVLRASDGDQVKLGFDADSSVRIKRQSEGK